MGIGYHCDDENYECSLSPELQMTARVELREDPDTRTHALNQMRDWVSKHPDIICCRTDANFLLRFLRTKKFHLPLAQELLERYITIRNLYPKWFQNLDVRDATIQSIIDSGYIVPLPGRDEQGRKLILTCASNFDPYKYSSVDMVRVHSIVVESLMDDEENQINGYVHVNDESGLSMGHISLWSLSDIRKMLRCIQNSTPMRHKSTHFLNVPTYANKVFDFFTSLLNEKLKNRIMLHSNIKELQKVIDPKILPKEYGGTIPLADMISDFKKFLETKRDTLLSLDDLKIELNKKMKFVTEMEDQQITGIAGSFRKLQVD